MTDNSDNETRVRSLIAEHLGVPNDFAMDATLVGDLGADSLDVVELSLAMEEEFEKQFDDDVVDKWYSGADLLASVND